MGTLTEFTVSLQQIFDVADPFFPAVGCLPKPSRLIRVNKHDLDIEAAKLLRDLFPCRVRVRRNIEAKLESSLGGSDAGPSEPGPAGELFQQRFLSTRYAFGINFRRRTLHFYSFTEPM